LVCISGVNKTVQKKKALKEIPKSFLAVFKLALHLLFTRCTDYPDDQTEGKAKTNYSGTDFKK
jgi:hypothetical protein